MKTIPVHQFNSVLSRIMASNYLAQNKPDDSQKYHASIDADITLLSNRLNNLFDYLSIRNLKKQKVITTKIDLKNFILKFSATNKIDLGETIPDMPLMSNEDLLNKLLHSSMEFLKARNQKISQINGANSTALVCQIENSDSNEIQDKDLDEEQEIRLEKIKLLGKLTSTKIKIKKSIIVIYVSEII